MTQVTQLAIDCIREIIVCLQRLLEHLQEYLNSLTPNTSTASDTDYQFRDPLELCRYCNNRQLAEGVCRFHFTREQHRRHGTNATGRMV